MEDIINEQELTGAERILRAILLDIKKFTADATMENLEYMFKDRLSEKDYKQLINFVKNNMRAQRRRPLHFLQLDPEAVFKFLTKEEVIKIGEMAYK